MNLTNDKCIFFVHNLLKHSRKGVHQALIELIAFPFNFSLCIVYLLQMYIKRRSELRGKGTKLLISWQKPHKPVSKDTIIRWIKLVLERSGKDSSVYTAHSTCAAALVTQPTLMYQYLPLSVQLAGPVIVPLRSFIKRHRNPILVLLYYN